MVPVPMVHLLHFCLGIFVDGLGSWGVKFIEDTASSAWNTSHGFDWPKSNCESCCPGHAKHCCQEGSPIH